MSFYSVINSVIKDVETKGYTTEQQLQLWLKIVRDAALKQMMSEGDLQSLLDRTLRGKFNRIVSKAVGIEIIEPELRKELNRRIYASADLIKLNKREEVDKTLRRLSGWITSGDTGIKSKQELRKSLKQLPFVERRVIIDQSHKLTANLNNIIAEHGGAIAVIWHSHWRESGYNYREDHKERDEKIYVIRGNWAMKNGLMKLAGHQYYDEITGFSVEPYCRCYGTYLFSITDLPNEMLTEKAKEKLNVRRI